MKRKKHEELQTRNGMPSYRPVSGQSSDRRKTGFAAPS
jgi:hypothetical protein